MEFVDLRVQVENLDVLTTFDLVFSLDNAGGIEMFRLANMLNAAGINNKSASQFQLSVPIHNSLSQSLYYSLTAAPVVGNFGVNVRVYQWTLRSVF